MFLKQKFEEEVLEPTFLESNECHINNQGEEKGELIQKTTYFFKKVKNSLCAKGGKSLPSMCVHRASKFMYILKCEGSDLKRTR